MNFPLSSTLQRIQAQPNTVPMDWIQVKTECIDVCDAGSDLRVDQQCGTADMFHDNCHKYLTDSNNGIDSTDVEFVDIKYEQGGDSTEIDEEEDTKAELHVAHDKVFVRTEGHENYVERSELNDRTVNCNTDQDAPHKRVTCNQCNKSFVKSWHMKRHMRMVHTNERPFACPVCYKGFALQSDMNRHVRIVHDNERAVACTGCDRRFAKAANMRRHAAEAHSGNGVPQFVCPVCDKIFANSRNADIHVELFHGTNQNSKHQVLESGRESNETISEVTSELTLCASLKKECNDSFNEYQNHDEGAETIVKYNPNTSNNYSSCSDIIAESTTNENDHTFNSSDTNALKLPTQCKICFRTFRDNWLMTRHERTHTGDRPYKCMECGKSFSAAASLKEHILTHTNELVCPVCRRRFTRRYYMKIHECEGPVPEGTEPRRTRRKPHKSLLASLIPKPPRRLKENAKGVRRHECTDCGQRFTRAGNLKIHQVIHTGERAYACTKCDSTFSTSSNLMMHNRQVHTDIRPFSCAQCDWKFARSSNLKTHARLCHGEDRPFQCTQCVKKFALSLELSRHVKKCHVAEVQPIVGMDGGSLPADSLSTIVKIEMDNDGKTATDKSIDNNINCESHELTTDNCSIEKPVFKCDVCSKEFKKRWGLTSHAQTHSGARPFACKLCDKTFGVVATLQRHMVIHTDERTFECTSCDRTFRRPNDLRIHMMVHTGELPHACTYCGWRFTRVIRLKRHVAKYHNGKVEQPFACTKCDQTFLLLRYLQKHELLHDGERKFACAECNTRYTTSTDLRRHMMKHSGERPYACGKCDRKFYRGSELRNHEMIHSGKRPFACEDCGKGYSRSHDLRIHRRSHSKNPSARQEKSPIVSTAVNNLPNSSHQSSSLDDNLANQITPGSSLDESQNRYACTLCESSFSTPENLRRHRQLHKVIVYNRHRQKQTFACSKCNKSYTTLGNLKKHESNHNGERRFACDKCDKKYAWARNLNVHKLTHEKEFASERTFSSELNMERRVKEVHCADKCAETFDKRPYVCSECQRRYLDAEQLKEHLVTHWFNAS